nr:PREDICTED: uncharacterized protein C11orf16 homolog isoform X1 [Lepisosteus oculatus]
MPVINPLAHSLGSLPLFGEIRDRNITFVIDTSDSMYTCLEMVKHHLIEALLAKSRAGDSLFNVVEFSYKVTKWCDRMVTCSPNTVYGALDWIRSLCCKPGRDLLGALIAAFDDLACQAVYLVTNGFPHTKAQEVLQVVSRVSRERPVHVFYVADKWTDSEELRFLQKLAQCTRGSCHLIVLGAADVKQVVPVYKTECWTTGPFYWDVKYCSAGTNLDRPVTAVTDLSLCASPLGHTHCCHPAVTVPARHNLVSLVPTCPLSTCEIAEMLESPLGSSLLTVGTRVLARREPDGYYYLGSIKQEVERRRGIFLVNFDKPALIGGKYQTSVQKTSIMDVLHYTEALRHSVVPGDKVLAPWETDLVRYGPGSVLSGVEIRDPLSAKDGEEIRVSFWNGKEAKVPRGVAVWISPALYEQIVKEIHQPLTARGALVQNESIWPEICACRSVPLPLCHRSLCKCHSMSSPYCSYYSPWRSTCCVPAHHLGSCLHKLHTWWPLTTGNPHYTRDPRNEDLDKKINLQLQELRESNRPLSVSSSSLSEEKNSDSEGEAEPTSKTAVRVSIDRAVNTDSSLFNRPRSTSPDRPAWKYWRRSHPEPLHKTPGNQVRSVGKCTFSSADVNSPEFCFAGPTNRSAMFETIPYSSRRSIGMKDVLAQHDIQPPLRESTCEKHLKTKVMRSYLTRQAEKRRAK